MILLKRAKIYTVNENRVLYGDILIKDGKIEEISSNIPLQRDVNFIDLDNNIVIPGLIDISTNLSLVETGNKPSVESLGDKTKGVISDYKTVDAINTSDEYFDIAVKSGVTSIVVNSGNYNPLGAQSCALKTAGHSLKSKIISDFIDLKAVLGETTLTSNSRMGVVNVIRENFTRARLYAKDKETDELVAFSSLYESLLRVLNREIPLKISANRAVDILKAIELKKEFNIEMIINGASEAYLVIEELKESKIPVILHSPLRDTSHLDYKNMRDDNGSILANNNILVSLSTNHPDVNIELILLSAGILTKNKMSYQSALESITINPAKSLGLSNRLGSIEKGKDADLVILDGDPFKSMTKIIHTIIDGEVVFSA